jgi:hypothetical protein
VCSTGAIRFAIAPYEIPVCRFADQGFADYGLAGGNAPADQAASKNSVTIVVEIAIACAANFQNSQFRIVPHHILLTAPIPSRT